MVEEMDSRLKRCPCCGGETVLGSLYGCRPWVTYWLPRYRSLLSPFFSRRNIEKSGTRYMLLTRTWLMKPNS